MRINYYDTLDILDILDTLDTLDTLEGKRIKRIKGLMNQGGWGESLDGILGGGRD